MILTRNSARAELCVKLHYIPILYRELVGNFEFDANLLSTLSPSGIMPIIMSGIEEKDRAGPDLSKEQEHKYPVFDRLFSTLLSESKKSGIPVTMLCPVVGMPISKRIMLQVTVNSCFADSEGRPTFVIIDGYLNGVHTQQTGIKGKWTGDVPWVTGVDPSRRSESPIVISANGMADIGRLAAENLSKAPEEIVEIDDVEIEQELTVTRPPKGPQGYLN